MVKNKLINFATIAGVTVALSAPAMAQTSGAAEQERDRTATERTEQRADEDERGVGQRMEDAWILTKVKTSFVGEDALEHSDINVDVKDGVVTLKGTVASDAGRERAKEIARETEGVVRVDDQLTIGMAAHRDDDAVVGTAGRTDAEREAREESREAREEAREAREEAREESREAREDANETAREAREEAREARDEAREETREAREEGREAGRETREAVGTAGTAVNDGWITTKVKTSFVGEDVFANSDIDVDTNDGVVTLKGHVASDAAKTRAEAIAKDIDGVKRVNNKLKIKADKDDDR
jgi:hyperosmotically inducible periplasmic protein